MIASGLVPTACGTEAVVPSQREQTRRIHAHSGDRIRLLGHEVNTGQNRGGQPQGGVLPRSSPSWLAVMKRLAHVLLGDCAALDASGVRLRRCLEAEIQDLHDCFGVYAGGGQPMSCPVGPFACREDADPREDRARCRSRPF